LIAIDFGRKVSIKEIAFTFQGGFVGTPLHVKGDDSEPVVVLPQDANFRQAWSISLDTKRLFLQFVGSTDFYGRVVVYDMDIQGEEVEA
jgi:hypothetical protein